VSYRAFEVKTEELDFEGQKAKRKNMEADHESSFSYLTVIRL